ncbi:MAG: sulfatase-like hydrolase/transferase [Elusimicrobiota bacterium]
MSRPTGDGGGRTRAGAGLAFACAAALIPAPGRAASTPGGARRPRSVIIVSIDTWRADFADSAAAFEDFSRTAARFDAAFTAATWTVPSHATMLTGRYPSGHGAGGTSPRAPRPPVTADMRAISLGVPMLAEILRARGLRTAGFYFGPVLDPKWGFARGFDSYKQGRFDGSLETTLRDASSWLESEGKKGPFFLFAHTFMVHRYVAIDLEAGGTCPPKHDYDKPVVPGPAPPIETVCAKDRARYAASVRCAGSELERLLDAVRRLGLDSDTLVIVTSDHGEALCEPHLRAPLLGHGYPPYESQIRVPLAMRFPDGRGAGARIASAVREVDIVPTVLDSLGVPAPPGLEGRSLLPLIGGTTAPAPVFAETDEWQMARDGGLKYVRHRDGLEELYDLAADPGETRLLADPARLAPMRATLRDFLLRQRLGYRLVTRGRRGDRFSIRVESDRPLGYATTFMTEGADHYERSADGRILEASFTSEEDGDEDWLAFDRSAGAGELKVGVRLNGELLPAERFLVGGKPARAAGSAVLPGGPGDPALLDRADVPAGAAAVLWRLSGAAAAGEPAVDSSLRTRLRAAGYLR